MLVLNCNIYHTGWGRVINIGSVHGVIASPYKSAYIAAKHGIVGLTKVKVYFKY